MADRPRRHHSDPELRRALEQWLAAESEGIADRLEAIRVAAEVSRLVAEVLDQRVMEARAHTGLGRRSARWSASPASPPTGDGATSSLGRALAEAEEARFRSSRWPPSAPWTRSEP